MRSPVPTLSKTSDCEMPSASGRVDAEARRRAVAEGLVGGDGGRRAVVRRGQEGVAARRRDRAGRVVRVIGERRGGRGCWRRRGGRRRRRRGRRGGRNGPRRSGDLVEERPHVPAGILGGLDDLASQFLACEQVETEPGAALHVLQPEEPVSVGKEVSRGSDEHHAGRDIDDERRERGCAVGGSARNRLVTEHDRDAVATGARSGRIPPKLRCECAARRRRVDRHTQ